MSEVTVTLDEDHCQTILMALNTPPATTWDGTKESKESVLDALSEQTDREQILY